jgi:pimeloyl-ACP methyl ester carboxylesterase
MKRSVGKWAALASAITVVIGGPAAAQQPASKPYDTVGPAAVHGYTGERCTVFRPIELKPGAKVILWGNGTGTQPVDYSVLLQQLASYGFVVAAANTPNAGSGVDMLGCLDWLTAENARDGSPYKGKLDLTKVGATGHSQGGGGTIMTGRDPRVTVTAPLMPGGRGGDIAAAVGQQHGPMLLLSGGLDTTAPPERSQKPVFEAAKTPMIWLTYKTAGHLAAMRDAGPYRAALTAWFLYQLDGDPKAAAMFTGEACGYCTDQDWTIQRKATG